MEREERAEAGPRVTLSGTVPGGVEGGTTMGEACPHKLVSTNPLRLPLYVLIPAGSLVAALLLLVLALTGIFGGGLFDSGAPPSSSSSDPPWPVAAGDHTEHTERSLLESSDVTLSQRHHGNGDNITGSRQPGSDAPPPPSSTDPASSSSPAPPAESLTLAPDWLTSVTSMSTSWPIGTTPETDAGGCQLIVEPQCHMLPYNQTWLSSSVAVVKSSEVDMLLRFFSYLSRLSCYRYIMLFGCSLALPECSIGDGGHDRSVVLPCSWFCEAARQGCEPVLQMFNASWPDFLRCSQFHDAATGASPATNTCYSPRQVKGKSFMCSVQDHFLCATGVCVPQKLVCNGYNDCDDWSDETHCDCLDAEFRCATGRCLSPSLVCDGYDDCGDLSDEVNCVCDPALEHGCGDGRCISKDWLCDGDNDCVDKTDELNCSCRSQGLLECSNGQCIPSAFHCDGDNDCKDGSDEENCTSNQTQALCLPGQSSCVSTSCPAQCGAGGTPCLPRSNCSQCEAITLELCMNLPYNQTSFPNFLGHGSQRESSVSWEASLFPALVQTGCYQYLMFYACTLLVPKCDPATSQRVPPCRSLCRSAKERCESVLGIVGLPWPEGSDCSQFPQEGGNASCLLPEDGIDECSPSHFKCRSGRCVLATKRCDGHLDCDDHSDEDNCGCAERGLWECTGSKVCIKTSMICDGFPDCPLLVDEVNCSLCRDNELECNNHQCVHRTLWCDGVKHCSDSSDEWSCVSLGPASDWLLTVSRSAVQYQVCADDWNQQLSVLTCSQLGLGIPSSVAMVAEQPGVQGRRRWLHVHPDWSLRNGSALQGRLEKRSHSCHSRRRVSVLCSREDCGLRPMLPTPPHQRKKRILGGRVSRPGWWPWQCSLQSGTSGHICGCVLIGRKWALTVAHCFEGRESADLWKVVLGINNLDHPGVHSQTRAVRSILVHPRYNRAVVDYDISVIELETEVEETRYVMPVCLPDSGQLPQPDSYCYITGWGHTGTRMPFKLQEGAVRIISLSKCQSYFDMKTITSRMLCAGFEAGTVDSCMGDSGGPLVCETPGPGPGPGKWTLFGLTSWGSVCFSKVLGPGVYSNVTHFTPWIQRQIYLRTYLPD